MIIYLTKNFRLTNRRQSAFIDLYEANSRDFSTIHQQVPDASDLIDEIADFMKQTETTSQRNLEEKRQRHVVVWNSLTSWLNRYLVEQEY